VEGEGYIMVAVPANAQGLVLRPCPDFSGMQGTRTVQLRFNDVVVPDENVLAHPAQFQPFIARIKPGFMLGQTGMGLGVIDGSLQTLREHEATHAHVNQFLDDQAPELAEAASALKRTITMLAPAAETGASNMLDVLK